MPEDEPAGVVPSDGTGTNVLGIADDLTLSQVELVERVSWLIKLRWLAFAGVAATLVFAKVVFDPPLPWNWLMITTAAIPAYNALCYLTWRRASGPLQNISSRLANHLIVCDVLVLGALIHFSGGVENPFAFYFVFHMVIASILLPARNVFLHATLAVVIFAFVAISEYTGLLPHYYSPIGAAMTELHSNPVFVFAAIWTLATALYVTVYLATSIAAHLRLHEDQIVTLSRGARRDAEELRSAYDKLARIDKAKSAYARKVAHELRSPLAAIESLLRVVTDGLQGEVPAQARDMIERARVRARGLLALVKDLLTLATAKEAKELADKTDVDLRSMLDEVARFLTPHAEARNIGLKVTVSHDIPPIRAHEEGIEELFTNLIGNAIKYSPEGCPVNVCLLLRDDGVDITVSDCGIGIDPAEKDKIFDEFYRAANARGFTSDGTGLGLSIVKSIAEAHGGSVDVKSELGKGTTFTVRLPFDRTAVE